MFEKKKKIDIGLILMYTMLVYLIVVLITVVIFSIIHRDIITGLNELNNWLHLWINPILVAVLKAMVIGMPIIVMGLFVAGIGETKEDK